MNSLNTPLSQEALNVFFQSLLVMLKGMFGVFVFMFIFYCLVRLLEYIFKNEVID